MKKIAILPYVLLALLMQLIMVSPAKAGSALPVIGVLDGSLNQLHQDSLVIVQDSKFFNPAYNSLLIKPYAVKNRVTFKINEASLYYLQSAFTATVRLEVSATQADNTVLVTDTTLSINYDSGNTYRNRSSYVFANAYQVQVKVLSVSTNVAWNVWNALQVETELQSFPVYTFVCTDNTIQSVSMGVSLDSNTNADELPVNWGNIAAADEYDLEWTYIDSSALANSIYGSPSAPDPNLVFANSASRVTITGTSYNIPMFYDGAGFLFFRVRSVQLQPDGSRWETHWSSDYISTGGLGQFYFKGHQRNLNWQVTTSFAEEGKRKTVIQYYDGSLRGRQTVTKDNTTDTTIVAETFYDYQGRPTIQVMPTPTLNTIIQYSQNFNMGLNGAYNKIDFDTIPGSTAPCDLAADSMLNSSGASQYYSPANPQSTFSYHQYIPDAKDYPFTQVEYTQDNTGRISRQGGVGRLYQLNSGHETKYYYGSPDQHELDALFGTEVGDHNHYFKNMVRDANGQYSVSYTDMHGRTIATALTGALPDSIKLDTLASNITNSLTETLADSNSVVIKDLALESQKGLLVPVTEPYVFNYNLNPLSLQLAACDSQTVCYDCLYNLEITITDDCNNQKFYFDTLLQNFSLSSIDTACGATGFTFGFTKILQEGSYVVTKRLSISQAGSNYYRDSVFMKKNTCTTQSATIQQQAQLLAATMTMCKPDCQSCTDSLGTYTQFYNKFMLQAGISSTDTASYAGLALQAYQDAVANCNILCNRTTETDDIQAQMLLDMTPPSGQYANPDSAQDRYSIFYSDLYTSDTGDTLRTHFDPVNFPAIDTIPAYQRVTNYVDENGNPDSVYNDATGSMVAPQDLDPASFAQKFKLSWAQALLPYHPEYCKLQQYLVLSASTQWDRQFEATDSYDSAMYHGYLNPTNNGAPPFSAYSSPHPNPDALNSVSVFYHNALESILQNYTSNSSYASIIHTPNSLSSTPVSMWALASASVKCGTGDTNATKACILRYANNDSAFTASMCPGDLDMAWRNFRQMYLDVKRELINYELNQVYCPPSASSPSATTLYALGHQPHFSDANELITASGSGLPASSGPATAQSKDSLGGFYSSNCKAYATFWFQQLSACKQYNPDSVNNVIIPQLVAVCTKGSDTNHPFGSSSISPDSANQYNSFEDVINAYNKNHGITDTSNCNAYGLTSPKPYNQQSIYSNKPVYSTKPDTCDCHQITAVYQNYKAVAFHYSSFSDYLNQQYQTVISDSVLNLLLNMCNPTTADTNCNYLASPIQLPPVLQCTAGSVCVSCYQFNLVNTQFIQQYPGIVPVANPAATDSAQLGKNKLYDDFMNYHLGFNKQVSEYFSFRSSCGSPAFTPNGTYRCDSLTKLLSDFNDSATRYYFTPHLDASGADTTSWKMDHSGNTYNDGSPFCTYFSDSTIHTHASVDIDYYRNLCIGSGGYTFETRIKVPDSTLVPSYVNGPLRLDNYVGDGAIALLFSKTDSSVYLWLYYNSASSDLYQFKGAALASLNDWTVIKIKCQHDTVSFYLNNVLVGTRLMNMTFSTIRGWSIDPKSTNADLDYVRMYDSTGSIMFNEGFNDCTNLAAPLYATVVPNDSFTVNLSSYFNRKYGTSYTYAQIDSIYQSNCGHAPSVCSEGVSASDSLQQIRSGFINLVHNSFNNTVCTDTTTWTVYQNQDFSNDDYTVSNIPNNTGVPAYSIFSNGTAKLPAGSPSMNYISYIHQMDTICLTGRYTAEARIRFNSISTDSVHRMIGYFDSRNDTLANYYFQPNTPDSSGTGNWRVAHWDMSSTGASIRINKLGLIFPNAVGNTAEIDWIRIKDQSGNVVLFEDFNSFQQFASIASGYQCAFPGSNHTICSTCEQSFQQYYNSVQHTSLSYDSITQWYAQHGINLGVCPLADAGLTLCGTAAPLFPPVSLDSVSNCMDSLFFAVSKGTVIYNAYTDSLLGSFDSAYRAKCLQAYKYESFTVTHNANEYHYTLYYYDQAGNLVKTVPPEGVHPIYRSSWLDSVETYRANNLSLTNTHTLLTQYRYNTLNQVVAQLTPDVTAKADFWYDRLGRLSISQNAKQRNISGTELNSWYSYTLYDYLGRITEVGQLANAGSVTMTDSISRSPGLLDTWIQNSAVNKMQITQTIYDLPYTGWSGVVPPPVVQRNLRNRVSYSSYTIGNTPANYNHASFYTYDAHGNVDTLLQDYGNNLASSTVNNVMNLNGSEYKRIVYQYDLISGKVNGVAFQPNQPDQFYHRYSYDAENRLIKSESSTDSVYWESDAQYWYYKHGPLARTLLGDQQVQGIDYAYTLQGWLKGINSTSLNAAIDMGNDGNTGASNQYVARDAYGLSLNYYTGDYTNINGAVLPFPGYSAQLGTGYKPLYNGNISSMTTNIGKLNNPMFYNYGYDQLNRITRMDAFNNLDQVNNNWDHITSIPDYKERIAYDANGNITNYLRNGYGSNLPMDSLSYNYNRDGDGNLLNNKLNYIHDQVSSSAYTADLQSQLSGNYSYDAIGNLTGDVKEGISNITWNVYGKITQIIKASDTIINYTYDAAGNRISKSILPPSGTGNTTWYVRDASGNVMSVYQYTDSLRLTEQHIYGSSRLGILNTSINVEATPVTQTIINNYRGYRNYELSNHLGNVLVTISDKKFGVPLSSSSLIDHFTADVVNANDYYPFGMLMPGRGYTAGSGYRYGFNGKEKSDEISGSGVTYDYGARIYDTRMGRFLSIDPISNRFPSLTPFQFSSNSPLSGIDLDGKEYLRADESRIELVNGIAILKIENMHNITKNSFNDVNNNPKNWAPGEIGISTKIGDFSFNTIKKIELPDLNLDNTYGANDPNYNAGQQRVQNPIAKSTGLPDRRYKSQIIDGASPKGSQGLAITSLALDAIIVGDGIARRLLWDDDFEKAKSHATFAQQAVYDVNTALHEGLLIPEKYRTEQFLSDIANVVLSGVSNSDDKKVLEIGRNIYDNISKRRIKYDGFIIIRGPSDLIKQIPKPNPMYDPNYGKQTEQTQPQSSDKN